MITLQPHAQTWSQQPRKRQESRPSAPLRLGDGFRYHDAASHASAAPFRRRMQQRQREVTNAQSA